MKGYIYKITSPFGKVYIGQTVNIVNRKCCYKTLRCKSQCKVYNSIIKYGWDKHTFEIIETTDKILLNEQEIYWINHYNSITEGLNLMPGGNVRIFSEESKEKMRQAKLGKKLSKEHKDNIGKTSKGRHTGKKFSKEHKDKMSKSHLGNKHSDETKNKISESHIGLKHSKETKIKIGKSRALAYVL